VEALRTYLRTGQLPPLPGKITEIGPRLARILARGYRSTTKIINIHNIYCFH